MGNAKICHVASNKEPWVQPYDTKNINGQPIPDGVIDDIETKNWRASLPQGRQTFIKVLSDTSNCQLFTWDMVRTRFLFENVKPELERTGPLTTEERQRRASEVALSAFNYGIELTTISYQLLNNNPEKNQIDDLQNFVQRNFIEDIRDTILAASIETLLSLNYDSSKLYGVGIGFEKESGKPALVTDFNEQSPAKSDPNIKRKATWIIAIDGKDILNSPLEEVRNLLRGPKDTEVLLTVRPIGAVQTPTTVRLKRVLFSASLL